MRFVKNFRKGKWTTTPMEKTLKDTQPSTFPCANFLSDAGILEDFLLLVDRVGLTTYMMDESNQYTILTKIFVESFKFTN
jgi:hypothetical protein